MTDKPFITDKGGIICDACGERGEMTDKLDGQLECVACRHKWDPSVPLNDRRARRAVEAKGKADAPPAAEDAPDKEKAPIVPPGSLLLGQGVGDRVQRLKALVTMGRKLQLPDKDQKALEALVERLVGRGVLQALEERL